MMWANLAVIAGFLLIVAGNTIFIYTAKKD